MSNSKVRWGKGTYGMMRYMKRVAAGHYQLKWQGDVVSITKPKGEEFWYIKVNGKTAEMLPTLNGAMWWVDAVWGNEPVETSNLLNPKAGKLMIARKQYGGCCDPGTETYWSM